MLTILLKQQERQKHGTICSLFVKTFRHLFLCILWAWFRLAHVLSEFSQM
jgi:hypothetical protein